MDKNIPFSIEIPTSELLKPRAGNINSISWGSRYGGSSNANYNMRLGIAWSSVSNSGYSTVTARLWIESAAIQTYGVAKTYTLNINGSSTSGSKTFNMGDWTSTFTHKLLEHTVNVNHTNATSITISGSFAINIEYAGVYVGTMSHSVTASLPATLTAPGAPTNLSLTGRFDNGMSTVASWNKGSGTVTAYEVQRRFWTAYDKAYTDWWNVDSNYNGSATSITLQHSAVTHHAQQVRIRAKNAAGTSAWVESNWVYHDGVNVYTNNSGAKTYGKVRVWNGSAWVQAYVSVWNGTSWSTTK